MFETNVFSCDAPDIQLGGCRPLLCPVFGRNTGTARYPAKYAA